MYLVFPGPGGNLVRDQKEDALVDLASYEEERRDLGGDS